MAGKAGKSGGFLRLATATAAFLLIAVGLLGVGLGNLWADQAIEFADSSSLALLLGNLVPFFPIFLILLGAVLLVRSRA